MSTVINLAAELNKSGANGPGMRYVVWVQGCILNCPGCFNPDFQPLAEKELVTVGEMAGRILATQGIEGVTYSGGEPMLQAEPLYFLSSILKKAGLGILCYSGYTLEELRRASNPFVRRLLSLADLLIDGRFVKAQKASLLWRGSSNQLIYFLTNRYIKYKPLLEAEARGWQRAEMEIVVGNEGIVCTGTVQEKIFSRLQEIIKG